MGVQAGSGARTAAWAAALSVVGLAAAGCAATSPPAPAPASAAARAALRCADERFPVYFARGSAEMRPESHEVVRTASGRLGGCRVTAVDVTGVAIADAAGQPVDPALVRRRADAVALALSQAGLPAPNFDVEIAGMARTASGVRAPLARRTEVVLHAQPAS